MSFIGLQLGGVYELDPYDEPGAHISWGFGDACIAFAVVGLGLVMIHVGDKLEKEGRIFWGIRLPWSLIGWGLWVALLWGWTKL